MPRFLVSLLAGMLVIAGGWYGWVRDGAVDDAVARSADRVVDNSPLARGAEYEGPQGGAEGERDRSRRGPSASTTGPGETSPTASATGSGPAAPSSGAGARPTRGPSAGSGADASSGRVSDPAATMPTKDAAPGRACSTSGPTDAAGWNRLFTQLDGEPTLEGADHGGSVALADGRRMFVFGDTIRDTSVVSPFMVRNSVLVTDGGCVQPLEVEGGGAAIPNDGKLGYWPMSLRATPGNGGTRVQVISAKVRGLGQGDFETVGSALATFEVPTNRMPRLVSNTSIGPTTRDPRVPTWGSAMWDSGGRTYVFGTASNATKTTAGWSLHVARTSPSNLGNPGAWEYWDGSRWVAGRPSAAQGEKAQLIPADQGVSHVLGVVQRGGSWYAVSKEGDYHGDTLAVWKASSVTGPWTKHRVQPLVNDSRIRRYTPLVHPDARTSSGQLLISWSESPLSSRLYWSNPELYRPRFAELSLP